MQSGYGTPEIQQQQQQQQRRQQLIDDDCCPSLFSISNTQSHLYDDIHHSQQPQHLQQRKHPLSQQMFPLPQQQQPTPPLCIPFTTYQLFRPQHQPQQFPAFQSERLHQQQLGLQQQPCPDQQSFFDMNFKLGLSENSGNKESILNQGVGTTLIHGSEQHVSGIRQHSLVMPHCWRSQEDYAIKQPFWCSNNQYCNEDKVSEIECNKKKYQALKQVDQSNERFKNVAAKYKLFGELEAIYSLGNNAKNIVETNQTGSGSALTAENSPRDACLLMPLGDLPHKNIAELVNVNTAIDHGSENSIREEASLGKVEKKKRKRKIKERLSSMIGFLEGLVKHVMDHQEALQRKFLELVQRMDKERMDREEEWRRQEAAKRNRDAIARAHERLIASNREALIISQIEKITGQSINLPSRKTPLLLQPEDLKEPTKELNPMKGDTNSRWPKDEVEALIQVRGGLESRFLEPGLKGPLWEEVSSLMAAMGYQRSAKRCKEKWENINKYFRKTKESGKKRSLQSKTCPYFDQLDQLYSRNPTKLASCSSSPSFNSVIGVQNQDYSELFEAFAAGQDFRIPQNTRSLSEIGSFRLNSDGIAYEKVAFEQGGHGNEKENQEADKYGEGEEEEEEEEEDKVDDEDKGD